MATNPLPAVGDRIADMHLSVAGESFVWTSDLLANGPCVWVVFEDLEQPDAAVRARTFDGLAEAFAGRGVALIGLAAAEPHRCIELRREQRLRHLRFVADSTGQVCGALGLMNGTGPRPCALVLDRDARVRAVVTHNTPGGHAAATLDAVEQLWPAQQRASA